MVSDEETLAIIKRLMTPNEIHKMFKAGNPAFQKLLGTPSGKFVADFLYLYDNPSEEVEHGLGWKLINKVTITGAIEDANRPTFVWEVEPYTASAARHGKRNWQGIPSPPLLGHRKVRRETASNRIVRQPT